MLLKVFSILLCSGLTIDAAFIGRQARSTISGRSSNSSSSYTVKAQDTCISIANEQDVSTLDLIAVNSEAGLNAECTNLEMGMRISLPPPCKTYHVKQSDTCLSIAQSNGLTVSTFFSLNPGINYPSCNNLLTDTNVCLDQKQSSNRASGPTPSSTPSTCSPNSSSLSVASGTNSSACQTFASIKSGSTCIDVASQTNITLSQLESLNPGINKDCTNLLANTLYCVKSGISTGCAKTQVVQSGDTCSKLATQNGITLSTFYSLNPSVDSQCTNLQIGQAYCV